MEKSLISLLFLGVLAAQNPVSFTFDHLPTDAELPPLSPNCSTTLTADVTISALTLPVASSSCFLISQLVTICTTMVGSVCTVAETMQISAIPDSTHLTIATGTRGFSGTSAAAHPNGKPVYGGISSFNHNGTNAVLKAVAAAVGARDTTLAGYVDMYPPSDAVNKIGWQAPATRSTAIRLVLPSADPTAGQVLAFAAPSSNLAAGSWVTPPTVTGTPTTGHCASWASANSIQDAGSSCGSGGGSSGGYIDLPAGGANGGVATGLWNSGLIAGSGAYISGIEFAADGAVSRATFRLPSTWTGTGVAVRMTVFDGNGQAGTVPYTVQIGCFSTASNVTVDPTLGTALTLTGTQAVNSTLEMTNSTLDIPTACGVGVMARVLVTRGTHGRTGSHAVADVYLSW